MLDESQRAVLLVTGTNVFLLSSELSVAEVVVSHVEKQPLPRTWFSGCQTRVRQRAQKTISSL